MGEGATQMHNHICITYFKGNLFTSEYFFYYCEMHQEQNLQTRHGMQFAQKNLHFHYLCTTRDLDHSRFQCGCGDRTTTFFLTVVTLVHTQAWPHTITSVHTCAHPHPPAHIPPHALNLINHMKLFLNKKLLHQFNFI